MRRQLAPLVWRRRSSVLAVACVASIAWMLSIPTSGGEDAGEIYVFAAWGPFVAMAILIETASRIDPHRSDIQEARAPIHVAFLGPAAAALALILVDSARSESFIWNMQENMLVRIVVLAHAPSAVAFTASAWLLVRGAHERRARRAIAGVMGTGLTLAVLFAAMRSDTFRLSPYLVLAFASIATTLVVRWALRRPASTIGPGPPSAPDTPTFRRVG